MTHSITSPLEPMISPLIIFNAPPFVEVIRLDKDGFHYKGQFIADAGEAHRLMVAFLKQNTKTELEPPKDEEIDNFLQERWHRRMAQESPFGFTDYDGSRARQASIDDTRAALERWGK